MAQPTPSKIIPSLDLSPRGAESFCHPFLISRGVFPSPEGLDYGQGMCPSHPSHFAGRSFVFRQEGFVFRRLRFVLPVQRRVFGAQPFVFRTGRFVFPAMRIVFGAVRFVFRVLHFVLRRLRFVFRAWRFVFRWQNFVLRGRQFVLFLQKNGQNCLFQAVTPGFRPD